MQSVSLDAAGHRRSPATLPGYHAGRPPRNKGVRYPADPPTIDEIVAVMRAADDRPDGIRLRALIVILWRAGLRISEALALAETDLDPRRGAVIVRHGKGGKTPRDRDGPLGMGAARTMARDPRNAPAGRPSLRNPRTDRRTTVGSFSCRQATTTHSRNGRRSTTIRAPPTPSRTCRRDGRRGSSARRDPTPTRSREPRNHLHLPPRHRQLRDHRHRPLKAGPGDLSHSRAQPHPLTEPKAGRPVRTTRQRRSPRAKEGSRRSVRDASAATDAGLEFDAPGK